MATKNHLLNLTWDMEQGSQGNDNDLSNPLSRAVNRLFREDGQPFEAISLCFFGDLDTRMPQNSPLSWLGVFVVSAVGRLLFFPGFAHSPVGIQHFQGKSRQPQLDDPTFTGDHVTLEPDHTHSHVTSQSRAHHPSHRRTSSLGHDRCLWFGMSIACETELRELKVQTIITAYLPSRDSERRAKIFMQARDGVEFCCVSLHPEARSRFQEGFLHFAFIVGPEGFPDYDGATLAFPFGAPLLPEPSPDILEQLPLYTDGLSLGSALDSQIVSMWLPGSLRVPFMLTWP
jgi:hypothetical protein